MIPQSNQNKPIHHCLDTNEMWLFTYARLRWTWASGCACLCTTPGVGSPIPLFIRSFKRSSISSISSISSFTLKLAWFATSRPVNKSPTRKPHMIIWNLMEPHGTSSDVIRPHLVRPHRISSDRVRSHLNSPTEKKEQQDAMFIAPAASFESPTIGACPYEYCAYIKKK